MTDDQTASDIADLQAELAFQSEGLHRLNEALATQQQDILMLQRQVGLLGEQLRNLRETNSGAEQAPDDDDRPPHY